MSREQRYVLREHRRDLTRTVAAGNLSPQRAPALNSKEQGHG